MNKEIIEYIEKSVCLICAIIWRRGNGDLEGVLKTARLLREFFRERE